MFVQALPGGGLLLLGDLSHDRHGGSRFDFRATAEMQVIGKTASRCLARGLGRKN
jgi:hypothetical protein